MRDTSGAMAVGIVERSKEAAIRRDIASGMPSGVRLEDIEEAIAITVRENRAVNQMPAIAEFAERHRVMILGGGPVQTTPHAVDADGQPLPLH